MKIRISSTTALNPTEEETHAVRKALDAVNGRANRWTISDYSIVRWVADQAEERLKMLPKIDRIGAMVSYSPGGPRANAYKFSAVSTRIILTRTSGGWWLTDVLRVGVYPREAEHLKIHVTAKQADALRAKAVADLVMPTQYESLLSSNQYHAKKESALVASPQKHESLRDALTEFLADAEPHPS